MDKVSNRDKELIERSFILGVASAETRRAKKQKKPKKVANISNGHHQRDGQVIETKAAKDSCHSPHRTWSRDSDVMSSEVSIFMDEINMNMSNLRLLGLGSVFS